MSTIDSLQIGMNWFDERPGGLDRVFKALIESLPAQGVNVRGLVAGSDAVAVATGGRVDAFAPPQTRLGQRLWRVRTHARRLTRMSMPDVVASHFALYAVPTAGVFRNVPRVVHFHGPWAAEAAVTGKQTVSRAVRRAIEWSAYRSATRHIVLSQAFSRILQDSYGVSEKTIRIVPGPVDVARFDTHVTRADARAQLGLSPDRPYLFCIRRLVSRMGLEDLIDTMSSVRQAVPDVQLIVAGKGPLEASLVARIAERGLDAHAKLIGYVPDDMLPLWYRAADLSVVPSVALEGFGLTVAESLAAGTPVLVTPVGGLPEVVAGLSEQLVLAGTGHAALGAGIADALRGKLALPGTDACRDYARKHFDHPVIAAQVAAVYREAIGDA